jgi:hypothetical protein
MESRSYEMGIVSGNKGIIILDVGARYFSKPARITYNIGLSLENIFILILILMHLL